MRVNLHNIVCGAIEQGLIEGYSKIASKQFGGTADDAIDCLFEDVMKNLSRNVDFTDEDSRQSTKSQAGFIQTDARAEAPQPQDEESDEVALLRYKRGRLPNK